MRHQWENETVSAIRSGARPREACGIFAVHNYYGERTAAEISFFGLLALQHRGQESAGMAYATADGMQCYRGSGLVSRVFSREVLAEITVPSVLGHVCDASGGSGTMQPLVARSSRGGGLAVAHNGKLFDAAALRRDLLERGQIFHTAADNEIMLALLFRYRRLGLAVAVRRMMQLAEGAYAAVVVDARRTVAFRDRHGFRPLCIGRLGKAYIFASESCALDAVGASFLREVEPGEIVVAEGENLVSHPAPIPSPRAFCIFEYIYFARPDSVLAGRNVHLVRKGIGAGLARRVSRQVDLVVPSPDSGVSAAMGLAEAAGLPLEWAIHRSSYHGRTFIEPTARSREMAARLKYNPVSALVRGKRVAVVDDSLVRGTTARTVTALLHKAGVAEVHLCIAAPPHCYPCYYGIDIPLSSELAAVNCEPGSLVGSIGANSITYAALEDLFAAAGGNAADYCSACFTGIYPAGAGRKVESG